MNSWVLFSNSKNSALKLFNSNTKNVSLSLLSQRTLRIASSKYASTPASPSSPPNSSPSPQTSPEYRNGSSGSKTFKLLFFGLTGFALGLGFVAMNSDARNQVESYVPQARPVLDYVDSLIGDGKKSWSTPSEKKVQPIVEPKKIETPKPFLEPSPQPLKQHNEDPKPKQHSKQPSTVAQKEHTPKVTKTETNTSTEKARTELAPKAAAASTLAEPKLSESPKGDWKATLNEYNLQEQAAIEAIENKLRLMDSELKLKVTAALNSSYVAIETLNKYRTALRNALDDTLNDDTKEIQWRQVTDLFDLQTADVHEANQKFALAKNVFEELDRFLLGLKSNELSSNVRNLRETQMNLLNQYRLVKLEQSKLSEAIAHANVLKNYTAEQKQARGQFLKEMQALQPEGIDGLKRSNDELSNDELNSLLIHAHKRVLQLQKQLEKMQRSQNQQIQAALEEQRKQNIEHLSKMEANLNELKQKEFELEKEKIIDEQKKKNLDEIKKELSRQAAAHNNHLAQMLRIQHDELKAIYEKQLINEKEKIRHEFYLKVAESMGRAKGIENALNARANLELQASNAKQLWLAVQSLSEILNTKAADINSASELVEVVPNIDKIRESAPDNQFIQTIVSSLSVKGGVWSEPDLKERFQKLKTVCNRVALIDERGGSLFKYFISYLQSYFIIHAKIDKQKLDSAAHEALNLNELNLDTFNILDYSEYYMESGNMEMAIRLMQQLKGEPARLAQDWIKEAIRLLEIRQACNLLNAYISSIYVGTNFK